MAAIIRIILYVIALSVIVPILCLASTRHGFRTELLHMSPDPEVGNGSPKLISFNGQNELHLFDTSRIKRDTAKAKGDEGIQQKTPKMPSPINENIEIKVNHLNDSHSQLMVHWLGDKTNVMICLARESAANENAGAPNASSVFFSYDYGDTFIDKTHLFQLTVNNKTINSSLDQFSTHPKYFTIIFTDVINKAIVTSDDKGKTFKVKQLNFSPSDLSFYEADPRTFIILDREDTKRTLYLTTDFGDSFTILQQFVKSFSWSNVDGMPIQLYVERQEPTNSTSVVFIDAAKLVTVDNRPKKFNMLIENLQDFYVKKDFMFGVRPTLDTIQLLISYKRGKFVKADFLTEQAIKGIHIVNVDKKRVFVSAAHSDTVTHLYVSESNSASLEDIKFVLSLENIFTYIPNVTWKSSWLVTANDDPFSDVYQVEGLNGIFIASVVSRPQVIYGTNTFSKTFGSIGPEHLISYITFDHGANWQFIKAPTVDDEGQLINCVGDCSLHLSQKFSSLYPVTRSTTIMSSKSAPGVIMAMGVIGKSLKGHPCVFISRDAGLTWKQILKTYYFFHMGDHGGILVAVKYFKSKGETREILYSTDEGDTWSSAEFFSNDLKIYGLMTETNSNSTIFTLFGSEVSEHRWSIIKVDLIKAFKYNCTEDDYKFWSPSSQSGTSIMPCILGLQESYKRRLPAANCYNGVDFSRPKSTQVCECNVWDFECDFGFKRISKNAPCIRDRSIISYDPYKIPQSCRPGQFYNRTKGYRKLDDDVCINGLSTVYLPQKIPCPVEEVEEFLIVAQRDKISRISLSNRGKEVLPVEGLKNVIAIEYDMKHNCVFWADIMSDTIGRQCLNGNESAEILVETELASVEGMSYDWISELLYFVDGVRTKIEAVKTSKDNFARMRKTIIDSASLNKPRGIAVHPKEGYLFWTDWSSSKPSLSRANLDGTDIRVLFSKPQVIWPNGVTIDFFSERVYWVDANKDYIASCDLQGRQFQQVLSQDPHVSHPFAVAVLKNLMYWDDWKMNAVFSADKDHGIMIHRVAQNMSSLMDMKVYAHSIQLGTNACSSPDNVCSHLCVGGPKGTYSCLCPDGMEAGNTKGECFCPAGLKPYANKTCPQSLNTCGSRYFTCDNHLCIPSFFRCDREDDCGDGSDEIGCNGNKMPCPPYMFTCKSDHRCIPEYFKCDFDRDCDDGSDEVDCQFSTCKAEEFACKNRRCILNKWVCDGEDDCRDGSDEQNCEVKHVSSCRSDEFRCKTNGACISSQWRCDNDSDCPDGSDEHDCDNKKCESWMFNCGDGRCIYKTWRCDGDKDCQNGLDEVNCTDPDYPTHRPHNPSYNPNFSTSSECLEWMFKCGDGKCIPYWWKCDGVNDCIDQTDEIGCPMRNDNSSTITTTTMKSPENLGCLIDEFMCDSGHCISKQSVCDGYGDCSNNEDEKNCSPDMKKDCGQGKFRCESNRICLPLRMLCDGVKHCVDGSDEQYCDESLIKSKQKTCGKGSFFCDEDCLPEAVRCNDKVDCMDQSDEKFCKPSERHYALDKIYLDERSVTSNSFTIYWDKMQSNATNSNLFRYKPAYSIVGSNVWNVHPQWIEGNSHKFTSMQAFTKYNITVYVRYDTVSTEPYIYKLITTGEGIPTVPRNISVNQLSGSRVQISWEPPQSAAGILKEYTVYYRPETMTQSQLVKVSPSETSIVLESFIKGNVTYEFWVRASNNKFESPMSKLVTILVNGSNIDNIRGLKTTNVDSNKITLMWQPIEGVEGYLIQPILKTNYPLLEPIRTKESQATITNLIPGVLYVFKVSAYLKNYVGRPATTSVTTHGDPLPLVPNISILKDDKMIKLHWKAPIINGSSKGITYGVYYGNTIEELREKSRVQTKELLANLTDLQPCESYLVSVGIIGPIGPGPLGSHPSKIETPPNFLRPPRNLNFEMDGGKHEMIISWDHNCMISNNQPVYLVKITDLTKNTTKTVEVKNAVSYKYGDVEDGAVFNVTVQAKLPKSQYATMKVYAPPLPTPRQLSVFAFPNGTYSVNWHEVETEKNKKSSYELVIYSGNQVNEQIEPVAIIEASRPPHLISLEDVVGKDSTADMYTLGVRLKTEQGYISQIGEIEHISLLNALLFSEETATGTFIWPFILSLILIVSLVGGILFLWQRHRRLKNSFSRFANSHYDTRTGATRIGGDAFEDDDIHHESAPRFDDDEPLVVS